MYMKKIYTLLFLAIVFVSFYLLFKNRQTDDYKNISYKIAGVSVLLQNGLNEQSIISGSASKIVTRYFGNEVWYDFNGDGRKDIAFVLTQETGGSGTFYYVVVALKKSDGYVGSEAVFVGDRISPQSTNINEKGFIVFNYADRKPGESYVMPPSVGKSIVLKFDPKTNTLGEVVVGFEGESR